MMRSKRKNKKLFYLRGGLIKRPSLMSLFRYLKPSVFTNRSWYLVNKFSGRFFKNHFFLIKKMLILVKNLRLFKIFNKYICLSINKYVFGNFYKFLSDYVVDYYDDYFFFLRKKRIAKTSRLQFFKKFFITYPCGSCFYAFFNEIESYAEDYESLDGFFFKGVLYDNFFSDLEGELVLDFLEHLTFDYLFDYNIYIIVEIYKLHQYRILQLINLYF